MRPFVFRAQAALDLRRRRDDDARCALAEANAEVSRAEARLKAALDDRDRAFSDAAAALARATSAGDAVWYRNWITGHQRDVAGRQDDLTQRRAAAQTARDQATRTHMDLRVLERLKERARRTYDSAVVHEEQKAIDWLAVLRSFPRARGQEETE
jgi:flagellar export protein FliJ